MTQEQDIKGVADARHFALAEGYAWARQDAAASALPPSDVDGRVAACDTEAATRFATAFKAHRRAFIDEKIGMAFNVAVAYDKWLRDGASLPTTREESRALLSQAPSGRAASRASDQGDAYWVVTVSRANGSALTFGPWDADRAHATKDAAEGADVAAFVVGKR